LNNDWVWLGAALEGCVAATLAIDNFAPRQSDQPTDPIGDDCMQKIQEAIASYKKRNVTNLALEASFRLIWYHIDSGRKKEAADLLMDTYEAALDLPLYNRVGSIQITLKINTVPLDYHYLCHCPLLSVYPIYAQICILY
jgi:hypothetical protein